MSSVAFLKAFAADWNRHDLDALMASMTNDCVFISSDGTQFKGPEAVREVFADILQTFPDAKWEDDTHFVSGNRGVSEWTFSGKNTEDGARIEERGCDIFTFREGKILLKNTYLK